MRHENFARRLSIRTLSDIGVDLDPASLDVVESQVVYPGDCGPQGRAEFSFLFTSYDHSVAVSGVWWDDQVFPLQISIITKAHI